MATAMQKIEEYEELFKCRYTNDDDDYREAVRKGQRLMSDVPVMNPWPPRKPYLSSRSRGSRSGHYANWDSRGRHRGGYGRSGRQDTYQPKEFSNYDRKKPNDHDTYEDYTKPYRDSEYKTEVTDVSSAGQVVHCVEETGEQCEPNAREQNRDELPQKGLDPFESPTKPTTDIDFHAILSGASSSSNTLQSKNLKKEKSRNRKKIVSKNVKQQAPTTEKQYTEHASTLTDKATANLRTTEGVVVSHGTPESVTTSILLSGLESSKKSNTIVMPSEKKRKWREDEYSGSDTEHIDVEGDCNYSKEYSLLPENDYPMSTVKQPFYQGNKTKPLMIKYPLKELSLDCTIMQTSSKPETSLHPHPVDSEVTRKRKSKKKKRHRGPGKEELDGGSNTDQTLTLKIKLH